MKLRIGSITFLLFLSSVAFPQATSRYLDKPLPQGWEEDTQIFHKQKPITLLKFNRNYSKIMGLNSIIICLTSPPELAGVEIEHKVEEAPVTTKRAIRRKAE